MFEKELERAKKQLKQQLATQDPYVTLQSIKGNGAIHPAYRTYFGAEVAWWIHEERAIRNSNPRFDTRDASFRELFSKVDEAYARTARFDHEEHSNGSSFAVNPQRRSMRCYCDWPSSMTMST
jgi:hypothetical protein